MTFIQKIIESPGLVFLGFFVVIMGIKEIDSIVIWGRQKFQKKHEEVSEEEDFHQKVCDIACTSEKHTETLKDFSDAMNGFSDRLDGITERLDSVDDERKKDTIANSRVWLYQLYGELKDKDELDENEYETFDDLAGRYLAAGGNSVFKDKIIPEIRSKKIRVD